MAVKEKRVRLPGEVAPPLDARVSEGAFAASLAAIEWRKHEGLRVALKRDFEVNIEKAEAAHRVVAARPALDTALRAERRARAMLRAKTGSAADVAAAEKERVALATNMEDSEYRLETLNAEHVDLEKRIPELQNFAQGQNKAKLWDAARADVGAMAAAVREVRRINDRLKAILSAAGNAFPWMRPEARAHGQRGGLPDWLYIEQLDDPAHAAGSIKHWFAEMKRVGLLDEKEK